jgi:hypothetical protein
MTYVAYTELGADTPPGTPVKEEDFDPDQWADFLERGNVVIQGGEDDPNVLAARAAGEGYEDPRDARIAELEAQLAATQQGVPVDPKAPKNATGSSS